VITAIMPCRGRAEQTVRNVKRLLATAGRVEWYLYLVVDDDTPTLAHLKVYAGASYTEGTSSQVGYWRCLQKATEETDAPLICNLANDLLPGRDWLARCYAAYRARFGAGDGLMGFNDGIHGPELSPHFLISRRLLDRYGGWPAWYRHTYGDAELCIRAQQDGCYSKAAWSVLYHDHPFTGGADDAVYAEGRAHIDQDAALFHNRKEQGWPTI
jgi:hypothetical protein